MDPVIDEATAERVATVISLLVWPILLAVLRKLFKRDAIIRALVRGVENAALPEVKAAITEASRKEHVAIELKTLVHKQTRKFAKPPNESSEPTPPEPTANSSETQGT